MTSSTFSLAIPACCTADSTAIPPSWDAERADSEDWKDPIGVLVAATITTSLNFFELKYLKFLPATCENLKENAILMNRRNKTFYFQSGHVTVEELKYSLITKIHAI